MKITSIKLTKTNRKILNTTLNRSFCKEAKIDSKILNQIKVIFVVMIKQKILGVCGLYETYYKTNELFIAIEKRIRKQGLGKKLMKKLIKWSQKKKIIFFIQSIDHKFYYPAINLYKTLGFNKKFSMGKKVIFIKKNCPHLLLIYRIIFFYLSSLKFMIKKILF